MTHPTPKDVIDLYLYGSQTVPDLDENRVIRSTPSGSASLDVDVKFSDRQKTATLGR